MEFSFRSFSDKLRASYAALEPSVEDDYHDRRWRSRHEGDRRIET